MKQFFRKSMRGAMLALGMATLSLSAFANEVKVQLRFDDTFTSDVGTAGAPFTTSNFNGAGPFTFTNQVTVFNAASVTFEDSVVAGQNARVARFPSGSFFSLNHNIAPNGGGTAVNQYTLILDMKVDSIDGYASLFQTQTDNTDDGDGFVRASNNGIGISGDYFDAAGDFTPFANPLRYTLGTWQRVVISINTNTPTGKASGYRVYVNGKLQNIVQSPSGLGLNGRFSLAPVLHILADEDGETTDVLINNFQMRDYAMSDAEAAALGAPTAAAINATVAVTTTASGTVKLTGLDPASPARSLLIAARDAQNNVLFYRVVDAATAETAISLSGLLQGQTNLFLTTGKHLNESTVVNTTSGDITSVLIELSGGDGNADNTVDILDLTLLIQHYNATLSGGNYLEAVDFNGDGANDIGDLLKIIGSYNRIGDI